MQKTPRVVLLFYIAALLICFAAPYTLAGGVNDDNQAKPIYTDVKLDHPDYVFITYLSNRSIMSGLPNGTFHPDDSLTRAQAAVILVKAAGLTTTIVGKASFTDVAVDYWAASYIEAAATAGYLKGYADGTFRPDDKLTRAQAISLIMRLSKHGERAALPVFMDMDQKHWAAPEMATALELKMIGTTKDSQQLEPDRAISRGDMSRALAILLIKDPGLNQAGLSGKVIEIQGDISLTRGTKTMALREGMNIVQGDILTSAEGSRANISYPDGSSTLVEENTQLIVKRSEGRNYIKQDGSMAVAVDYLNIEVKQGTIFGALATKQEDKAPAADKQQAGLTPIFASRNSFGQLAAAEGSKIQPWYRTAEQKKVKIKCDMPWGVAAVRGTFYKIMVNPDGSCKVSCLTGNVELTGTNGKSVFIGANQTSAINSAGATPVPAGPMDQSEINAFAREQAWVLNTAIRIDMNRGTNAIVMLVNVNQQNQNQNQRMSTTLQAIINALHASGIQVSNEVKNDLVQQLLEIEKQTIDPYRGQDMTSQLNQSGSQDQLAVNKTSQSGGSTSGSDNTSGSGGETNSSTLDITYAAAGTYGPEDGSPPMIVDNVTINASGVTLRNTVVRVNLTVNQPNAILQNVNIGGNSILGAGIAEGDVAIINCLVAGNTLAAGGGGHSIHLAGSSFNTFNVDKNNNVIRIVAEGSTSVGAMTLNSGATLEETGLSGAGFSDVILASGIPANAKIILSGDFSSLTINSPNLLIMLESGSIGEVNIGAGAANTKLNLAAGTTVNVLKANASASITGTGQITEAIINANGVIFEQVPLSWTINGAYSVVIDGETFSSSGTVSHLCELTGVATLTNLMITGTSVSGNLASGATLLTVIPTISPYAGWGLYADLSCTTPLAGNSMNLTNATTTAYIKVTAQDGAVSQVYTLTVTKMPPPPGNTDCNVLAIDDLTGTTINGTTISGQVSGLDTTLTVNPAVSDGASWAIFSDSLCSVAAVNPISLNYGLNTVWIKVTAADTVSSQVYELQIYRPSNNTSVTSPSGAYSVGGNNIAAGTLPITTSISVDTFLSNLAKDNDAAWKVVIQGAVVADSDSFDNSTGKTNVANLMFGDMLVVKAADGTVNTYNISVILGDPVVGAGVQPPPPAGLKITFNCPGFIWGKYRYFAYDYVDDRNAICVVAFDSAGNIVGQWEHTHGASRYVTGYSIEVGNQTINFSTNRGNGIKVNFNNIVLPQP